MFCEVPAARSGVAAGVSHDNQRAQTRTFERPGASNTTKIPRERRKNEISGGREKKKREILAPPPTLRAPLFLGSGPHRSRPTPPGPPPGPHLWLPPLRAPTKNKKLAKCGLANFGQQKLAKFGQIRMAKCGQLTLATCGIGQIRFGQIRPRLKFWPPNLSGLFEASTLQAHSSGFGAHLPPTRWPEAAFCLNRSGPNRSIWPEAELASNGIGPKRYWLNS